MKKLIYTVILSIWAFSFVHSQTVMEVISNSPDHTVLEQVLTTSGLNIALEGDGPFTVFAPTDDAFAAVDSATLQAILDDPDLLEAVLLYHVLGFEALSGDLSDGLEVTTLQGADVTVTINADGVFINDAQVTMADIPADNGVVHVIDAVLVPPADEPFTVFDIIEGSADHLTLTAVLETSGLDAALSNPEDTFTVFAPTDDAFEAVDSITLQAILDDPDLLEAVLLYHVLGFEALSGDLSDGLEVTTLQGADVTVTINADGVFINDAQVTMADIPADNGVVHVINAVLVPPADEPFTVFDIIEGSADHLTLTAVLETSGLDAALSNPEENFTVFAPTDDAFEAVDSITLQAILDDPELLEAILLYHVLGFEALSGGLSDGLEVTTLQGADVTVTINADGVFINDAQVTLADIPADNGVVHLIDAVLVPPADEPFTVLDIIINSPDHAILTTAVIEAGLEDDLSAPDAELTVFAPTDDAFNALPEGVLEELLDDPEGALRDILLYHVAGGIVLSTDLEDGMMITTLQGENLTVSFVNGNVLINDAVVIIADEIADNGVVHVIDAVLTPPTSTDDLIDLPVSVYPNPVSSQLQIQLDERFAGQEYNILIHDSTGRLVSRKSSTGITTSLSTVDLAPGSYILLIENGEVISRTLFVVK